MKIFIVKKGWLKQKYHFVIKANNGKTIASSEKYYNHKDCYEAASLLIGLQAKIIDIDENDKV